MLRIVTKILLVPDVRDTHVGIFTYTPKENDKNNDSKSDKNNERVDSDDDKKKAEDKTEKDDKNVLNAGIPTLSYVNKIQCF